MMMHLWQTTTAATVASAANAAVDQWQGELTRDIIFGVVVLLILGFLVWQALLISRQNVQHEDNARARAAKRGDPEVKTRPFPGAKPGRK